MSTSSSIGQIDTTTLYGVIASFTSPEPKDCHEWAWNNINEASIALSQSRFFSIAPVPPRIIAKETGPLAKLTKHLSFTIDKAVAYNNKNLKLATQHTRSFITKNKTKIHQEFNNKFNEDIFNNWLSWHVNYAWQEHMRRVGSLYDLEFKNELAEVLNLTINDLDEINERAKSSKKLKEAIKQEDEIFEKMVIAYGQSIIIRGFYYDYLSNLENRSNIHHPVRSIIIPDISQKTYTPFKISNTEQFLIKAIIYHAFSYKFLSTRIKAWCHTIEQFSKLKRTDVVKKINKDYGIEGVAIDSALEIARSRLNLNFSAKTKEAIVDLSPYIGFATISTIIVSPWVIIPSVAIAALSYYDVIPRIPKKAFTSEKKFKEIMKSKRGRIRSNLFGLNIR